MCWGTLSAHLYVFVLDAASKAWNTYHFFGSMSDNHNCSCCCCLFSPPQTDE